MRQELQSLKGNLAGHLRIGAIPTTLPFAPNLTVPFHERFPEVKISVISMTSAEILSKLENLEIDAGMSYSDNEPIGRMTAVPLYEEQYMLLVNARSRLGQLQGISWNEASKLPLCLLTPDAQSRRIIDQIIRENGEGRAPTFESNSMMTLFTHVRTGHWVGIVPSRLMDTLERPRYLKTIPLHSPRVRKMIGLLLRGRQPYSPVVSAFIAVAQRVLRADGKVLARTPG
jgi:DNA-binding transcriptional LysR family regulator